MSHEGNRRPWLAGYFTESSLWPVTFVLLAHGVLGIAVALLDAIRRQGTLAILVLAVAATGTLWAAIRDWRRGRLGLATPTLLALWALGAVSAWAAARAGLY
jgi:uncharacterized membrane protein (DUF4010 family)